MAKYVDGFVLVVPKKKVEEYKKMAKLGAKIWMRHGALQYFECRGEDLVPNMDGWKASNFPKIAKATPDDDVWFSFIVFKSKKHREQVNTKVMKDPAMSPEKMKDTPMPFDMKRFSYGGFEVAVEA